MTTATALSPTSGIPTASNPIAETQVLTTTGTTTQYELTSDAPVTVDLGPYTEATWLQIKVIGGPVVVGFAQGLLNGELEVSSYLFLNNSGSGSGLTALTLTRTPATDSVVTIFMGQSVNA